MQTLNNIQNSIEILQRDIDIDCDRAEYYRKNDNIGKVELYQQRIKLKKAKIEALEWVLTGGSVCTLHL